MPGIRDSTDEKDLIKSSNLPSGLFSVQLPVFEQGQAQRSSVSLRRLCYHLMKLEISLRRSLCLLPMSDFLQLVREGTRSWRLGGKDLLQGPLGKE